VRPHEDRLSRELLRTRPAELPGQHLTLARDAALPVRMVVTSVASENKGTVSRHVRADLIGKVVMFDGDRFIVDFTRQEEIRQAAGAARRVR
jgi:hypothetical protein